MSYKFNIGMTPEKEQEELCRLNTWKDQIELNIFICAECKSSICNCDMLELKDMLRKTSYINHKGKKIDVNYTTTRRIALKEKSNNNQ